MDKITSQRQQDRQYAPIKFALNIEGSTFIGLTTVPIMQMLTEEAVDASRPHPAYRAQGPANASALRCCRQVDFLLTDSVIVQLPPVDACRSAWRRDNACGQVPRQRGGAVRIPRLQHGVILIAAILAGCVSGPTLPPAPPASALPTAEYRIGPGDSLNIFVWRNPELSVSVPVRPDGRISIPLVNDVIAVGKTPTQLSHQLQQRLSKYVANPIVTVMPTHFIGPFSQQVRVIGEAVMPRALPYRADMTVLDAMIEVGGLTKYAAGNRAILVRDVKNVAKTYPLHLDSLINDGEIKSNVALRPGDVIIIPQSYF